VVGNEIFPEAAINASGSNFTEIRLYLNNQTGWPARLTDRLSFRYYFTLEAGVTPSQITLTANFNQCLAPTGPTQHSGNIYYITVSCQGVKIYPGGQPHFRKEVQFRIASSGAWDPSNDWSFNGVGTTPGSTPVLVQRIPVYDNGVKVFGDEPGGGVVDTQPPTTPANLRVTGTTSSTVSLAWDASTDDVGVTAYQVFRGTTLAGSATATMFTDTGRAASTAYTYTVVAQDASGKQSTASAAVSGTTTAVTQDYTLAASPATATVVRGATATSSIAITRTGSFAGSVAFSATGLPAGVTVSFSPSTTTANATTATFTASTTATLGAATVTVTGTSGTTSRTATISLTVSAAGGDNTVTITPVVSSSSGWFSEQQVRLANTGTLSALSVTVVVQRTAGVSAAGQYNSVGSQVAQSNSSTATQITYQFTLAAGQTLGPGTNRSFAVQMSGNGTVHPTSGDTYTVTYTTGGQTFTQSGTF
jgi:endoglucanase